MKIIFLIFLGLAMSSTQAQQLPFRIGDTVPDLELTKDKAPLTIIDLWATWCSSCLRQFPKLDSLQARFGDSVQILLVNLLPLTGDSYAGVNAFSTAYRQRHPGFALPFLISRSQLIRFGFPGRMLPHYIWLNRDNVVIGITAADAVTGDNIRRALRGEYAHLPLKTDFIDYSNQH